MYHNHYQNASECSGTGFGGNPSDNQLLKNKLKEANQKAALEDRKLVKYLKSSSKALQDIYRTNSKVSISNFGDKEQVLVDELVNLFRSQVPQEWSKRYNVYSVGLDVCEVIFDSDHLELAAFALGDESSACEGGAVTHTLLTTLQMFAKHAEMIEKQNYIGGSVTKNTRSRAEKEEQKVADLIQKILRVNRNAEKIASKAKASGHICISLLDDDNDVDCDIMGVTTLTEEESKIYKVELGPIRFEIVECLKNHSYGNHMQGSNFNTRKVFKELTSYTTTLPVEHGSSIFVRAIDGRLDLLRALITGPEGTPYANGCFIFDILLPASYPQQPPKFTLRTTGNGSVRFNPNLYKCGKVCLSLLGTWTGPGWIPGSSTLLQVLISIQSLILVPDPYYNEPGYASQKGTLRGDRESENYDRNIRQQTLTWGMKDQLENIGCATCKYPEFVAVIRKHFAVKRATVIRQITKWKNLESHQFESVRQPHCRKHIVADRLFELIETLPIISTFIPPAGTCTNSCAGKRVRGTKRKNSEKVKIKKKQNKQVIELLDDVEIKPAATREKRSDEEIIILLD